MNQARLEYLWRMSGKRRISLCSRHHILQELEGWYNATSPVLLDDELKRLPAWLVEAMNTWPPDKWQESLAALDRLRPMGNAEAYRSLIRDILCRHRLRLSCRYERLMQFPPSTAWSSRLADPDLASVFVLGRTGVTKPICMVRLVRSDATAEFGLMVDPNIPSTYKPNIAQYMSGLGRRIRLLYQYWDNSISRLGSVVGWWRTATAAISSRVAEFRRDEGGSSCPDGYTRYRCEDLK